MLMPRRPRTSALLPHGGWGKMPPPAHSNSLHASALVVLRLHISDFADLFLEGSFEWLSKFVMEL